MGTDGRTQTGGKEGGITRRQAAAGLAAAGVAAAASMLAGCALPWAKGSEGAEEQVGAPEGFLPVGSVVTTDIFPNTEQKMVIVGRRVTGPDKDSYSPDYAACLWPYGMMTGPYKKPVTGEVYTLSKDSIKSVVHTGYADDEEQKAAAALDASPTGTWSGAILIDQYNDTVNGLKTAPGQGQ